MRKPKIKSSAKTRESVDVRVSGVKLHDEKLDIHCDLTNGSRPDVYFLRTRQYGSSDSLYLNFKDTDNVREVGNYLLEIADEVDELAEKSFNDENRL